jgi:hypothetical protein
MSCGDRISWASRFASTVSPVSKAASRSRERRHESSDDRRPQDAEGARVSSRHQCYKE